MKKYYFLLMALIAVAQMSAQSSDTVSVINQPNKVVITQTPSGVRINVVDSVSNYSFTVKNEAVEKDNDATQSSDWELNFPYNLTFKKESKEKKRETHWTIETKGIYFGAGLNSSFDLVNNSFNWGILDIASINYNTLHGQHFSFGVGYDSKRFSLKRPHCFVKDENTKAVYTDVYPEGVSKRSSILNVRAIQFPLLFQQDLGEHFHVVLGASMNWNVYAKCKTQYTLNHVKTELTYRHIKQEKITFDVIGGLSFHGLAVYCRFSPCNVLQKGYGPEIKNTWTLGGAIAF